MQSLLNFVDHVTARQALFLSTDGKPFTTSRAIAEKFGKRHDSVLRSIENILKTSPDPDFGHHNFVVAEYLDKQKKPRLEYQISHDGFAILAMGFTGEQALAWKMAFLTAFNRMEAELHAKETRFAKALDQVRPCIRPVTEATEQGADRKTISEQLGRSVNSVTYHRRRARQLGLLN